jgi:nucleotide-binding universal stress UspA family protein/GNAT superfamily N-acetyltransferase
MGNNFPEQSVMFEKVLIPTDLSEPSENLVASAGGIKNIREIILLHILDREKQGHGHGDPGQVQDSAVSTAWEKLSHLRELIRDPAITVRLIVQESTNIPEAILKTAEIERPSLIIMGARKGLLSRCLLGSGGTAVLSRSRTHILVMRFLEKGILSRTGQKKPAGNIFTKVLFPLDFSKPAKDALSYVERLHGISEVILLHVIRKTGRQESLNLQLREVEKRLSDARETIRKNHPDIRVKQMVRFGNPFEQICRVSSQEQVSLIMMSRFGKMDYLKKIPLGITTSKVAGQAKKPVLVIFTDIKIHVHVRELSTEEFYFAEKIWIDYHSTKSDPGTDRIFCVFVEDTPVSVARCKRHPDGYEIDGIFTWKEFRGNGYARKTIRALIDKCGDEILYMYAVLPLVNFYSSLGFEPIAEHDLPETIRERYAWAMGDMNAADVCPMKRVPDQKKKYKVR